MLKAIFDTQSNSPATPVSISSSFLRSRSRAGSSSAGNRPPPPPIFVPAPRKGSLPTLPSLHTFVGSDKQREDDKVVIRARSSSLPEDSLLPYFAATPPTHHADPVFRPSNTAITARSRTESSADKAEELQASPLHSPAFSVHSNTRASSHLSRPSSPVSKAAWRQSLVKGGADNHEESLHNTSAEDIPNINGKDDTSHQNNSNKVIFRVSHASTVISSPTDRSEAHSVPHEAVQTPRDSYVPVFQSVTSARSDKSFDLSQVPFNLQSMPPPVPRSPLSPRSPSVATNKQTSRSASVKSSKSARARRHSIASTTTTTRKNNRDSSVPADSQSPRHSRSSKKASSPQAILSPPATAIEQERPQVARRPSIAWETLLAEKAEDRPFRWKPVKVSHPLRASEE